MSAHAKRLAARCEVLRVRSTRLRSELATDAHALGVRFRIADRIVAIARSGQAKLLLGTVASLILFGRPRRIIRLAFRLLTLWPAIVPLVPHVKRLLQARGRDEASA